MLPDASGCTDWADPILAWALAAVGATAKSTTSGSVESQNRPNGLVIAVIAEPALTTIQIALADVVRSLR